MKYFFVMTVSVLFSLILPTRAFAQWSEHPNINNAVCTAINYQNHLVSVSDNDGGVIVAWEDGRSGHRNIYAQKLDVTGKVMWEINGVAICTSPGAQVAPTIASDGVGGAIIAWFQDSGKVYAQHVNQNGVAHWQVNGLPICNAGGAQEYPSIVADGIGGAIITWRDKRNGVNYDIYAQRISASGDLIWPLEGIAICKAIGDQYWQTIISDNANGAIITWQDYRNLGTDVYAQRVDSNGLIKWKVNGIPISTSGGDQTTLRIVSDYAGGALITWISNDDIYAQRIDANGVVQWATDGIPVCTATNLQGIPNIACDGVGGAIITWKDFRSGTNSDIYAQRLNGNGTVLWDVEGVSICSAPNSQYYGYMPEQSNIVSDGLGGAIITWEDHRRGDNDADIYAQRINGAGMTQWMTDGVPICTAVDSQFNPVISTDCAGGAIITWVDQRNGNFDIYAQNINRYGFLGFRPTLLEAQDVIGDQGGKVLLRWGALPLDKNPTYLTHYSIWRSVPEDYISNTRKMAYEIYGGVITPNIRMQSINGVNYFWEWIANQPAHRFSEYSYTVGTLFDSTSTTSGKHYFLVSAQTNDLNIFYDSNVDSGYSVDNLAPLAPRNFIGAFSAGVGSFNWSPNIESDLKDYVIYRGASLENVAQFSTTPDTFFIDNSSQSGNIYWAVRARDVHENLSPLSNIVITDIYENRIIPTRFLLNYNYPNPFNPKTIIRYELPEESMISIKILNQLGQVIEVLEKSVIAAGYKEIEWNASNFASGIYFYKLDAVSIADPSKTFTQVKKMILLK